MKNRDLHWYKKETGDEFKPNNSSLKNWLRFKLKNHDAAQQKYKERVARRETEIMSKIRIKDEKKKKNEFRRRILRQEYLDKKAKLNDKIKRACTENFILDCHNYFNCLDCELPMDLEIASEETKVFHREDENKNILDHIKLNDLTHKLKEKAKRTLLDSIN